MKVPLTWYALTCAFSERWDWSWPTAPDKRRFTMRSQKKIRLNRRRANKGRRNK